MVVAVAAERRQDVAQTPRPNEVVVTVKSDGSEKKLKTTRATVGEVLQEAGIELNPQDMVMPASDKKTKKGQIITVVRVQEVTEEVVKIVPFDVKKEFSDELKPGKVEVMSPGRNGEKIVRHSVRYEDGKPVRRTLTGVETVREPETKKVRIGSRSELTSRGSYRTRKVVKMHATGYDPGPRSCGKHANGITACGYKAGYGIVAVDPKVIPLRTHLYIEGYGYAIAGDVGSAIKGNRIDLGFDTYREAIKFGRKQVVVHVLEK